MPKPNIYFLTLLLLISSCQGSNNSMNQNMREFRKEYPDVSLKTELQATGIFKKKELAGDFLLAVVNEKGLVFSFALNENILQNKPASLNNDSPIYIASHTKSFTGTLLKILEEKGMIDLNGSVAEYIPELNFHDSIDVDDITIKALLNHTHGIFSTPLTWKTAYLGYSGKNSELIADLNNDFLYDSSHEFRYSNVGPIIAAMVSGKVTGNTWKEEMEKQIFEPLKMNHTSTYVSAFDYEEIRPSVIISKTNNYREEGFYKKDITMHASGGIISTINDLSKWLSANIREDEKLLSKNSWPDMHMSATKQNREYFTYDRTGYSLGWDLAEYQGDIILTRFGGLAGISFHISFMPEKKTGIIAFSGDNRAFLLPHLMANYVYNQINSLPADSIFMVEKKIFDNTFDRENSIKYPPDSRLLSNSTENDKINGTYLNTEEWPGITIRSSKNHYTMNWGVLEGKIYNSDYGGYTVLFGVLDRSFEIRNDTLKTGSLIYIKQNNLP